MIELSKDAFSRYQNAYDMQDYLNYRRDPENFEGNKTDMQIYDLLLRDGFELGDDGTYYLKELISYVVYELHPNETFIITYNVNNSKLKCAFILSFLK